jgi:hypothetical protein
MRDAWAVWDDTRQAWVLGSVFDAAYCETCETDASLAEETHAAFPGVGTRLDV